MRGPSEKEVVVLKEMDALDKTHAITILLGHSAKDRE